MLPHGLLPRGWNCCRFKPHRLSPCRQVSAPFTLLRSWGPLLDELRAEPEASSALLGTVGQAGRGWPRSKALLLLPKDGAQLAASDGLQLRFALVGNVRSGDSLLVLLDGQSVGRAEAWERSLGSAPPLPPVLTGHASSLLPY
jgi:hypothetical protein